MIPTGAVVGRALGVDLTKVGSKRTGATNALRALGFRWALVVFIGDFVKGLLAVVITGWLLGGAQTDPERWAQVMAGSFAVLGHTFSPLLGFRGGRGIVTGGGGLLILSWESFLVCLIVGSVTVAATRYVSLGSVLGTIAAGSVVLIQVALFDGPSAFWVYGTALPAFILVAHRDNIYRLATGTERKLSKGSRSEPPPETAT